MDVSRRFGYHLDIADPTQFPLVHLLSLARFELFALLRSRYLKEALFLNPSVTSLTEPDLLLENRNHDRREIQLNSALVRARRLSPARRHHPIAQLQQGPSAGRRL
jgi:hypothetical protein